MSQEQFQICAQCVNKKFDPRQGLICSLTGKTPTFEKNCQYFSTDEKPTETAPAPAVSETIQLFEIDEVALNKLRMHQDFYYALMGGLLASLIGAMIWAVVSVAAKFQIGYMAIGVGILVGYAVRFFGAGVDKKFGFLGAILSLLGCLGGNLFTQVGFIAQAEGIGYLETLSYFTPSIIVSLFAETFSPVDLLFYGIAVYEGYRFSFRKILSEEALLLKDENYKANPANHKLRLPLVILSIVLISIFIFFANRGVSGFKTFYYDSGAKLSEGEMDNSKQIGSWNYWYENGNRQQISYFTDGRADSTWQWFNESGILQKIGNYKNGIEHGIWITFYDNGAKNDSGSYFEGRMNGPWKIWHENGALFQTGFYKRNAQDSIWHTYFANGKLNSVGNMKEGSAIGKWINYYENGNLESEIIYKDENTIIIENTWDKDGNQSIRDGNGIYETFSENGNVIIKGNVIGGKKTGQWLLYYDNGKQKEEIIYRNDSMIIKNSWTPDGKENVVNGSGKYRNYMTDGSSFFEEGEIKDGKREGFWTVYHGSSDVIFMEQNYIKGVLSGEQKIYYESGNLYSSGQMDAGLQGGEWNWYYESGGVSSSVKFVKGRKDGKQIFRDENGAKSKEENYENGVLTDERVL